MLKTRVIPCLLLKDRGLVKTVKFKRPTYVGDPVNAVRIFNDKEADELILLDILASKEKRSPDFDLIADIASECFMPLCYGGGVRTFEDAKTLFSLGVEKVSLNTAALDSPDIVRRCAEHFGSQSVVAAIDVKKDLFGRRKVCRVPSGKKLDLLPRAQALLMEQAGAGEIFLNSVDRDGTMTGYDAELVRIVSSAVNIPVIACGGAGSLQDFRKAVDAGASAVSAGSMFVFQGRLRAVLISYPLYAELEAVLQKKGGYKKSQEDPNEK